MAPYEDFLHKAFKKGRVFGVQVGCGVYWGLGALRLGIGGGGDWAAFESH